MNMTFIQVDSSEPVVDYTYYQISSQLREGKKVLWLVSGGSAIDVTVAAAKLLAKNDTTNLILSLIDERFGTPGHPDSNWQKLMAAGLDLPRASLHPVLKGGDIATNAASFSDFLENQFASTDCAFGLLGIGPDGHTSGVLPHSPAVNATGLVCAYDGPDFKRITTTARALEKLDEAVVYAAGKPKWQVLDRLETNLSVAVQPAQMLKNISKLTIFTDRPNK